MFRSFTDLEKKVTTQIQQLEPSRLVVACPYEAEDVKAVIAAQSQGLVQPILVGDQLLVSAFRLTRHRQPV